MGSNLLLTNSTPEATDRPVSACSYTTPLSPVSTLFPVAAPASEPSHVATLSLPCPIQPSHHSGGAFAPEEAVASANIAIYLRRNDYTGRISVEGNVAIVLGPLNKTRVAKQCSLSAILKLMY